MRKRQVALTGPAAAALYGLDGYRDLTWPQMWCSPANGLGSGTILRTRWWEEPITLGDVPVAPIRVVLRHLGSCEHHQTDGLSTLHRTELAAEHCLRDGHITAADLRARGGTQQGDQVLRVIARLRADEPPTESWAETRALQLMRDRFALPTWRQVPVIGSDGTQRRVDFVIPYGPKRRTRPMPLLPIDGLLVEIDSFAHHGDPLGDDRAFDNDHDRESHYDANGFDWVSFTPKQVEQRPRLVDRVLTRKLAGHRTQSALTSHTLWPKAALRSA